MIAVNLADLTTIRQQQANFCAALMLIEPVMCRDWVDTNPWHIDAAAVALNCDDARANALAEVVVSAVPQLVTTPTCMEIVAGIRAWLSDVVQWLDKDDRNYDAIG